VARAVKAHLDGRVVPPEIEQLLDLEQVQLAFFLECSRARM